MDTDSIDLYDELCEEYDSLDEAVSVCEDGDSWSDFFY